MLAGLEQPYSRLVATLFYGLSHEQLDAVGDSLERFPQRGRPVRGTNLREWTLVYPYIIRYRIAGDDVRILRVRHGMRRS
jgi:plasmid stabilization system protein ParE